MANYTKEKWQIDGCVVYALNNQRHPSNRFFCGVIHGEDDNGKLITTEELIANANLIVAAPAMYEALKAITAKPWSALAREKGKAVLSAIDGEGKNGNHT